MAEIENSVNSSEETNSSHGSSVWLENSNSLALQEEWSGVSKSDLDLEITDPLQGIFYHLMPSKEDTTILFYNKPLYNNLLGVLSKQFQFPSEETQTFTVKMHVKDKKTCFLNIDKRIKSIRASGPGHLHWKENQFKKMSENMYKSFVKETNSVLNSSNTADIQDNESLSASQALTQPNQSGTNYTATEGTEVELPVVLVTEQGQVDPTNLQDMPVLHHITMLIDMIHKQQSILNHLTQQVNRLVEQAANESLYKTVDQISPNITVQPSEVYEDPFKQQSQEENGNLSGEQEPYHESSAPDHVECPDSPNRMNTDDLPSPGVQLLDLQTRSYSEVARTSTPKTPQRPSPVSRQTRPPQSPESVLQTSSVPSTTKQILLLGDSLISSVNPKGLKQNVFRNGIS